MLHCTFEDEVDLATVAIRVKDRDKMIAFYRDLIGFELKGEENALAIMGIAKTKQENLWIEESPRAQSYEGQIKRLKQLGLHIGHLEELADLYARLIKADYSKVATEFSEDRVHLLVEDPEENFLDIYVETQLPVTSAEKLLENSKNDYPKLSVDSTLDNVSLHVLDKAEEGHFLSSVIGFDSDEGAYQLALSKQAFWISLEEKANQTLAMSADDITGLEVVKFVISQKDLLDLEKTLQGSGRPFYIDHKKTIIAVSDPAGVEWWYSIK